VKQNTTIWLRELWFETLSYHVLPSVSKSVFRCWLFHETVDFTTLRSFLINWIQSYCWNCVVLLVFNSVVVVFVFTVSCKCSVLFQSAFNVIDILKLIHLQLLHLLSFCQKMNNRSKIKNICSTYTHIHCSCVWAKYIKSRVCKQTTDNSNWRKEIFYTYWVMQLCFHIILKLESYYTIALKNDFERTLY
jgi:hypothetical protein